jgi:hypothetical protein
MKNRRFSDDHHYTGFTPQERITGVFGRSFYDQNTRRACDLSCGDTRIYLGFDKEYLTKLLEKTSTAPPTMIGVDEIPIRKGHAYPQALRQLDGVARVAAARILRQVRGYGRVKPGRACRVQSP